MASGPSQSYGGGGVFQLIEGFVSKVAGDFLIQNPGGEMSDSRHFQHS